ncbi:hypothetical protein BJ170DRAFT_722234 [Xylariales sp. AK1849]|nr:hypothetical protein BJ170DRAFT_722234 [Xylariales sp. AK1849]
MPPIFPVEIMQDIVWCLIYGWRRRAASRFLGPSTTSWGLTTDASQYAAVCKSWQEIVERETFSTLNLNVSRLHQLNDIVDTRRRPYVRLFHVNIVLSAAWGVVENGVDKRQDNAAFVATLQTFLDKLRFWTPDQTCPDGIQVVLNAGSPSHDVPYDWNVLKQQPETWEKRYTASLLALARLSLPPRVDAVSEMETSHTVYGRCLSGAAICAVLSCLANAKKVSVMPWEDETDDIEARRRWRSEFAHGIDSITRPFHELHIFCVGPSIEDHSLGPPILTPVVAGEDALSLSLRNFSQNGVRNLSLRGFVIGDEFFWPRDPSPATELPHWACLRVLNIDYRLATPSGVWRFEHCQTPDRDDAENINHLRKRALPAMNDFYMTAGRAALEMPCLQSMKLTAAGLQPHTEVWHSFSYRVEGATATAVWTSNPAFEPDMVVVDRWKSVAEKIHGLSLDVKVVQGRSCVT